MKNMYDQNISFKIKFYSIDKQEYLVDYEEVHNLNSNAIFDYFHSTYFELIGVRKYHIPIQHLKMTAIEMV